MLKNKVVFIVLALAVLAGSSVSGYGSLVSYEHQAASPIACDADLTCAFFPACSISIRLEHPFVLFRPDGKTEQGLLTFELHDQTYSLPESPPPESHS